MDADLDDRARRALDRLELPQGLDDAARAKLQRLAIASDFAIDTLARQPALLARLLADDGMDAASPPILGGGNPVAVPGCMSTRRAWMPQCGVARSAGRCESPWRPIPRWWGSTSRSTRRTTPPVHHPRFRPNREPKAE